jgi:hypothetical protein
MSKETTRVEVLTRLDVAYNIVSHASFMGDKVLTTTEKALVHNTVETLEYFLDALEPEWDLLRTSRLTEAEFYRGTVPDYGDCMTVASWLHYVANGFFNDYDGIGHAAKAINGVLKMAPSVYVLPSKGNVPKDATHIIWFNG